MNLLEAALAPLALDDLKTHFLEEKCLVIEGAPDKFENLVTVYDIERQLNNGSNANVFAQVIVNGNRETLVDSNCAWTPASFKKACFLELIQADHSFMLANASQVSRGLSQLCYDIESSFKDEHMRADVHLYVSLNAQGGSYYAHRDRPQHKLLLQAVGDAHWQLFEPKEALPEQTQVVPPDEQDALLNKIADFTLSQGDLLYMPAGMFHRVTEVSGPRISISVPFYAMAEAQPMDRTHIPFAELFTTNLKSANGKKK